jgi:D-sedoheptulose 7-phosphate isomerase
VLVCGNGGSAADSQHIAGEMVIRYFKERKAYKVIALSTDTSVLTAGGNDYGYEHIFERQVEALGRKGDILIGISTSSNSPNIIKAVECAKKNGIYSIGLLGRDGGKLKPIVDLPIIVETQLTPVIQIWHSMIYHSLCHRIEELMEKK